MNAEVKAFHDALDLLAVSLSLGPVARENQTPTVVLCLLLERLPESHRQMVIDYWCCALSTRCSNLQAVAIVNEWVADGTLEEKA